MELRSPTYPCTVEHCFQEHVEKNQCLHASLPDSPLNASHSPPPKGSLVSPNSVPTNLDGNKAVERRPSKAGVSRESSSVDFSKVTQSKRRAQKVSVMVEGLMASSLSFPFGFWNPPPRNYLWVWAESCLCQKPPSHCHTERFSQRRLGPSRSLWLGCPVAGPAEENVTITSPSSLICSLSFLEKSDVCQESC